MPTRDLVVQLLLEVFRVHSAPWEGAGNAKTDRLIGLLRNVFTPVNTDTELAQLLHGNRISRETSQRVVVYLRPPAREECLVPLLAGEFKLDGEMHELRIRVGLFGLGDDDATPVSAGFRFETPEGPDRAEGRHNFYHVQPIDTFAGQRLTAVPPSVGTSAIPLDAHDPVGLVLCVLISLYGTDGISALSADMKNFVSGQIQALRAIRHRPQYFRVKQGPKTTICCSRRGDEGAVVRRRYPAASIENCSVVAYDGAAAGDRDFIAES